jgi:sulfonate transport system substrate-binding protein
LELKNCMMEEMEEKMRHKFSRALRVLLAAAILLPAACGGRKEAGGDAVLRVAYLPTANYFTILAEDSQRGEKLAGLGIRAEFIGPSSPAEALNIVGSGNADVTSIGTGRFINLIEQGGAWVAFALEKYSGDSQGIVAAPGSGINSLEDLYGKKIGISQRGATADYVINTAFAWAGLDASRVEKIELADADFAAAFVSGQIDAIASYDQHYANAIAVAGAKKLVDGTQYGSLNWSIHIANAAFARRHPEVLRAAYLALRREAAQAGEDPGRVTATYRKFGASDTQISVMRNFDVPRILPMDGQAVRDLQRQARQYADYGFIKQAPEDFSAYVLDFSEADGK